MSSKKEPSQNNIGGRSAGPQAPCQANVFQNRRLNRVDLQVFLLTAVIVILSCSVIFLINYRLTYESMIGSLRERAINIHEFLDTRLDKDSFTALNEKEDGSLLLYRNTKNILEEVRQAAGVRYLYTAKETESGEFIYLVDGLPSDSEDFRYVNDIIEPECIPDLKRAMAGETVFPEHIVKTTWGPVFISYFPMHENDEVIGALGMEFYALRQYNTLWQMRVAAPIIILISCLAAAAVAVLLFRRISNPSYRDMANTDFLTGHKNRNAFEVDLYNLEKSADKEKTVFISADLDKLKTVNDTFGHAAGDEYIRTGCRIISDAVGSSGVVYRIGGDEFAVILKNISIPAAEKMIIQMNEQAAAESERHEYRVSFSSGCAAFEPARDQTLSNTLLRSDQQMYEHKKYKTAD